jgi:hypothetical protein
MSDKEQQIRQTEWCCTAWHKCLCLRCIIEQDSTFGIIHTSMFVKGDGVFLFSDAASLLTRRMEKVQDNFGLLTVFTAIFNIVGVVLFISTKQGPCFMRKTNIG